MAIVVLIMVLVHSSNRWESCNGHRLAVPLYTTEELDDLLGLSVRAGSVRLGGSQELSTAHLCIQLTC